MNKKCASLSYRDDHKKVVFSELNQDMNIEDFHQHCKELAAAIGYADKSIQQWFDGDDELVEQVVALERKVSSLEAVLGGVYT